MLSGEQALLGMVTLVASQQDAARSAYRVSVSVGAERIASEAGADVVWTRVSVTNIMDVAASVDGMVPAGSQEGGFIFPRFLPVHDAPRPCATCGSCWPVQACTCPRSWPPCPGCTRPEGSSDLEARQLAQEYARHIRQLLR